MTEHPWYALRAPESTDTPALLVYPDRIRHNIQEMIRLSGDPGRLVPHVKTHKMARIVRMQLEAGIRRFKCATIAEADMLAEAGAEEVILAYQLSAVKAHRYLELMRRYPAVHFRSLVDNLDSAQMLDALFGEAGSSATVLIDIDNGMHRTGFPASGDIAAFYRQLSALPHLDCVGLHVYDGHIRDADFDIRRQKAEEAFLPVTEAVHRLEADGLPAPQVVAGGSPTFPVHARNPRVLCSPGTSLLWDAGYSRLLQEQPLLHAAVLMTRVISRPAPGRITTDLGHKSVAAENPPAERVAWLDKEFTVVSQSEEHMVLETVEARWAALRVGDVLYAVPGHVCPTVALYDEVQVVEEGQVTGQWPVEARRRKIHV